MNSHRVVWCRWCSKTWTTLPTAVGFDPERMCPACRKKMETKRAHLGTPKHEQVPGAQYYCCLLYTSDAADE